MVTGGKRRSWQEVDVLAGPTASMDLFVNTLPHGMHMSNPKPPKLLDRVRDAMRLKHYSLRTEETYIQWIRKFILFHGKKHPKDMAEPEITAFLTHLAVQDKVSASTQNQALSAILFLYRVVLNQELEFLDGIVRAKKPMRLPLVFHREEVERILAQLQGTKWLMASLLYGSGLRLMECLRLRVKDVDFQYRQITIRDGKGEKDRITMLPEALVEPVKRHLIKVKALHDEGFAGWLRGGLSSLRS
jgi:integrase